MTAAAWAVREAGGASMTYRPGTVDEVVLADGYQARRFFPPGFAPPPDAVIVDVGAHIGMFAVHAARLVPQGRVEALEPDPENLALLCRNAAGNGLDNVSVHPVAVEGTLGTAVLYQAHESWAHSTCAAVAPADAEAVVVAATTLAAFLAEEGIEAVDFLKMNIEGAEYDVLLGAPDEALRAVRLFHVECHPVPGHDGRELVERLADCGFAPAVQWSVEEPGKGWITAARRDA